MDCYWELRVKDLELRRCVNRVPVTARVREGKYGTLTLTLWTMQKNLYVSHHLKKYHGIVMTETIIINDNTHTTTQLKN